MADNLPVPSASGAVVPATGGGVAALRQAVEGPSDVRPYGNPWYAEGLTPFGVAILDTFNVKLVKHGEQPSKAIMLAARETVIEEAIREEQVRAERDAHDRAVGIDELRGRWGTKYQANLEGIRELLKMMPEDVAEELQYARLPNGQAIMNNPHILEWLAMHARVHNAPARSPAAPQGSHRDARIMAIEERMRTDRRGYNSDEAMQTEYRQLLEARGNTNG